MLVVICIVIVLSGSPYASSYLIAFVAAESIFASVALFHFVSRYGEGEGWFSKTRFRELTKIGIPSIPGSAAGLLLAAGDRFVIGIRLDLTAVAIYTLGYRFAEYTVQLLFMPFASAFGPVAIEKAAHSKEGYNRYIEDVAMKSAGLAPLVVGLIAILGPQLIAAAGGGSYSFAYPVFLLAMFGIVIYNVSQLASVSFAYHERLSLYVWVIIAAAVLNLSLNWIFVPIYGIVAAAFVTIAAYDGMLCASVVLANRISGSDIRLGSLHLPLVLFGAFLLVVYGIDQYEEDATISLLFKAIAWMLYVGVSWAAMRSVRDAIKAAGKFVRRQRSTGLSGG